MRRLVKTACLLALLPAAAWAGQAPEYTDDNRVVVPGDYREWVFLTSSLDLNYDQAVPGAAGRGSMLDNVFVNPDAYKAFLLTGAWPDKTVLVKENRVAESAGTISKSGKFQTRVASMELHVKDAARGGWTFFVSNGRAPGHPLQLTAACYSCHSAHGAVDTTFVQFYPTLLEVAKAKSTLSAGYLKEAQELATPP